MGKVVRFAALNAKIDAISGKMLTPADYENLMNRQTVTEMARYLQEHTYYRESLESLGREHVRRSDLETLLHRHLLLIYERLMAYMQGPYQDFMKAILERYEVADIKLILRAVSREEDIRQALPRFEHSKRYSRIDFEELLRTPTIEGIAERLRHTPWEDAFRSISEDDLHMRQFHLEMNLDILYFQNVLRKARRLEEEDQAVLREVIGINIDAVNLQWIYRARKYFGLNPEEILNYTVAGGLRYPFSKLKDIVYQEDARKAASQAFLRISRYDLLPQKDIYLDRNIDNFLRRQFRAISRRNTMNIAKLMAFLHELEYEIRDIITITEAIRYDEKIDLKNFLIRDVK